MTILAAHSTSTSIWAQPGTLGFLVVFGMGVVLYFVFRSMAKQLRKVRDAARVEAEREAKAQGQDGNGQAAQPVQDPNLPPIALPTNGKGPFRRT